MRNSRSLFVTFLPVIFLLAAAFCGAEVSLKSQAKEAFQAEQYPRALELLHRAQAQDSTDAEVYYLLGYYLHYLCYDSRPLSHYGRKQSDQVIRHLRRALDLDPSLGNARYFLGAEYGARARFALLHNDIQGMKRELRNGYEAGGYPPWLLEYNRNILRSAATNAILFVGGDAEATTLEYLQTVRGVRPDVTIIPGALLHRPWFVERLKSGLPGVFPPAPVSIATDQIRALRPYKWRTDTLKIPIPDSLQEQWNLTGEQFTWVLEPDLTQEARNRPMLSAGAAVLADIIQTNAWDRPVYFSLGMPRWMMAGLEDFTQLNGLTLKLVPVDSLPPESAIDAEVTEGVLTNPENYADIRTVLRQDMPRVNRLLVNYVAATLQLGRYYRRHGMSDRLGRLRKLYESTLTPEVIPAIRTFRPEIDRIIHNGEPAE